MEVRATVAHELDTGERMLLAAVARREPEAIAAFHHRYLQRVYSFIYYRVGESAEDAEEIAQDTFLAAIQSAGRYRGDGHCLGWLYGIARHKTADFLRRCRRSRRSPECLISYDDPDLATLVDAEAPAGPSPALVAEKHEMQRRLRTLLEQMPPDERDALVLRYVEGFTVREIAGVLGRSEKASESLLSRSRRRAYTLGKEYFTDETDR